MSAKTMGQVWDLDLPQNELLVLLALADHADHEGRNMFPGVALLAWKTGYSERTVIRLLNKLVKQNILIRRHRPGLATVYDANLDAAPKKADRPVKKPKTRKAKTHDIAMSYDTAMSLVTSSPVQKTATPDTPSRKVSDEPSIKQPSERDARATDNAMPDHIPPHLRKIIELPTPQPDGGALSYALLEAYCDAWNVTQQSYRDAWHKKHQRAANDLAALGATPEEVTAMVKERRAQGKQPAEAPMVFLARDYVDWKFAQTTPTPTINPAAERAALEAAERARIEWERERAAEWAQAAGGER